QQIRQLASGSRHSSPTEILESDGFYESLGADLIHFPFQNIVRCNLPTIYHPWDLQHLHFPEFVSRDLFVSRERLYRAGCRHAKAVAAPSNAVKNDLVRQYGLDPEKIFVIRQGAPTALCGPVTKESLDHVTRRYELPESFVLYPAQTWRHKNHLRLLEALHLVRTQHNLRINL